MKEKKDMKLLPILIFTFIKIGAFTFGGGYAMIALLENEFVSERHWLSKEEFLDMVALAESTPGPIAINSATYIGYRMAGILGSIVSTLAVSLPSFVIIYVISLFFEDFLAISYVGYAFRGISACVVYLIFSAGIKMLKGMKKSALSISVMIVVLCLFVGFSLFGITFSSIWFIIITGCLSLAVFYARELRERRRYR